MAANLIELPNGAAVFREGPSLANKWAIAAPSGEIVGYRRDKQDALAFAASLVGERQPVAEVAPSVSLSPRADKALRALLNAPAGAEDIAIPEETWPPKRLEVLSRLGRYAAGEAPPRWRGRR
jgi:hypothetical protein